MNCSALDGTGVLSASENPETETNDHKRKWQKSDFTERIFFSCTKTGFKESVNQHDLFTYQRLREIYLTSVSVRLILLLDGLIHDPEILNVGFLGMGHQDDRLGSFFRQVAYCVGVIKSPAFPG